MAEQNWHLAVQRLQWHLFSRDVMPHRAVIHSHCLRMTGDHHIAEDLLQETMIKAYKIVGQLCAGLEKPKAFLCKTATNLWIDWQRQSRRGSSLDSPDSDICDKSCELGVEFSEGLQWLLSTLSPMECRVFILREYCGYTGPEIARLLDSTLPAVKMAASRARRRLNHSKQSKLP